MFPEDNSSISARRLLPNGHVSSQGVVQQCPRVSGHGVCIALNKEGKHSYTRRTRCDARYSWVPAFEHNHDHDHGLTTTNVLDVSKSTVEKTDQVTATAEVEITLGVFTTGTRVARSPAQCEQNLSSPSPGLVATPQPDAKAAQQTRSLV